MHADEPISKPAKGHQRQVTFASHGHVLTNVNVWSPDGRWMVYDVRPDAAGGVFEGERIELVNVQSGELRVLYECQHGARCGVATFSPAAMKVAFIHGPEHPSADWSYSACHRQGMIVDLARPDAALNLDARNIIAPYTPGALRGGTHVHVFSSDGQWVSFTYDDHVLTSLDAQGTARSESEADINQRNVGVSAPLASVKVPTRHPRNHDGSHFSVLVTRTHNSPRPGSDEIRRAFEEAWVGSDGYLRSDGTRQRRALAFQGEVIAADGRAMSEVFIVDVPDDITQAGDEPLEGSETRRPAPPRGAVQRRLTFTADRRFPGIQGPRHWLRSSPDGERIAFLMKDDAGVVQLWTVSPRGGAMIQVTRGPWDVASAFTWSPDGKRIACVMDHSVFVIDMATGEGVRLTQRDASESGPRPEACVFSPDGERIAIVRQVRIADSLFNQIFVVEETG
ncbi:MAG: DUF3748 domain-containing protein [Phycisphaeraceae bacterium]